MWNNRPHTLAALVALSWAGHAAAADSLIQSPRGDDQTFTIFYLHSKADGTTVVEEKPVTLKSGPSRAGKSDVLFDGPLDDVSIRWSPDGNLPPKDAPPNHEKKARLQLVLQGEFIVEVSNGQEVRVKPGNLLLQEDATGYGHKMRCYAPKDSLGCVQMTMDAVDPATFFKNVSK
jgi:hypothetical protein